jgi:hypothetical protein
VFVADSRRLPDAQLAQLASKHHVTAVGPIWIVHRGQAPAPLQAFTIEEREPTTWEWYTSSGSEPIRSVVADEWTTWELRQLFGQPGDPPHAEPKSTEQRRIAYNLAVERDDASARQTEWSWLHAAFHAPRVLFDDGSELVGVRFDEGVQPTLTLLFRAAGPATVDWVPVLRSRVIGRAAWSTTMADPVVREVGPPPSPAPLRWRAEHMYSWRVPIRKRPGRELFELHLQPRARGGPEAPHPKSAGPIVVLELF